MLRKLALKVACLGQNDRDWITANLNAQEASQLTILVDEVVALGLTQDQAIRQQILDEALQQPEPKSQSIDMRTQYPNFDEITSFWQQCLATKNHIPPAEQAAIFGNSEETITLSHAVLDVIEQAVIKPSPALKEG